MSAWKSPMTVLLLALALILPPGSQAAPPITVALYLVVPPGVSEQPDDAGQAKGSVQAALAWWRDHDPARTTFVVRALRRVTLPRPGDDGWLLPIPRYPAGDNLAVWVYVNRDPWYTLPGSPLGAGLGLAYGGNVITVLEPRQMPWTRAATIAHEVGHVVYTLPDLYRDDPACAQGLDLMCNADAAYIQSWLGCRSLARIGGACRPIYLPLITEALP